MSWFDSTFTLDPVQFAQFMAQFEAINAGVKAAENESSMILAELKVMNANLIVINANVAVIASAVKLSPTEVLGDKFGPPEL